MPRPSLAIIATLVGFGAAQAQHAPASPYAGWEHRTVKALSNEQLTDLRAGRGMGLALAAELNGYPGPVHVLELGDQLRLTEEPRTRVQELHAVMKAETIPLGERLITQEADLDRQFAAKSVTPASLQAATAAIGATQGALRLSRTCAITSRR
jgi:nucleoid-associated protein YgaU